MVRLMLRFLSGCVELFIPCTHSPYLFVPLKRTGIIQYNP